MIPNSVLMAIIIASATIFKEYLDSKEDDKF